MRILLFIFTIFATWVLHAAKIGVIYPERSVPESERRYARALADHVERWYRTAGIAVDMLPDTAISKTQEQRLLILVDCYNPPSDVVQAVKAKLTTGTRFVVCYSASASLAQLFGLKPVSYKRSPDAWGAMAFSKLKPKGAPELIAQRSTNIFDMAPLPAKKPTYPIAHWQNTTGKATDVAWWKTPNGSYWMTHVLTGDGDAEGKQKLLLAIAAETIPGIWQTASRHLYNEISAPLTTNELSNRIRTIPRDTPKRKQLDGYRNFIKKQQATTLAAIPKDNAQSYNAVCDLRDFIARVYGMTYPSRPGEICGVWDHTGQGLYPGNWEKTAKQLAAYGITDVYVNVAGAAFARYPSKVLPQILQRDCLREAVAACHRHGLRVHAWILTFSGELMPPTALENFKRKGWLLQEANGKQLNWVDPTHPAVRQYLLSAIREMATHAQVDGIHLDFIRFPGLPQSLGPQTRARFEAQFGKVANWPAAVTEGESQTRQNFFKWRANAITDMVASTRQMLKTIRPGIELSVAVYGKYPACINSVGQDWLSWLRLGLVDYALPMNYTEDINRLRDWLGTQTGDARLAPRIIHGIGVTAAESRLGPLQVLEQINEARRFKCAGFALFDLDNFLMQRILPVLHGGITQ